MEKKNLVMVCLCAAIAIMAVAYAAFSTTLTVNGTVEATGTFAVTFNPTGEQITCDGSGSKLSGNQASSGTVTAAAGSTSATLAVNLITPTDVVVCNIPIKNTGTLDAKKVSVEVANDALTNASKPVAVEVSAPEKLAAGAESNVVVTVTYNWDGTEQPTTPNASFVITSNYTQDI